MYIPASEKAILPDVSQFIELLNSLNRHPLAAMRALFNPARPLLVSRAPGRLDVMGGIADYSGSLVLQLPIAEAALVALQKDSDRRLTIISLGHDRPGDSAIFKMPLADFENNGHPIDYPAAENYFKLDPQRSWAAYAAGAFLALMREKGIDFSGGARILIQSNVPEGKGVSSSAAVEVAVMAAVAAAFGVSLDPRELALLCQLVENRIAGAPCGVMDQMTAACGQPHQLLALLCQPAEIQGQVAIPPELAVWGIDSGIRHAVSGADYGSVRVGAFMGYKILQRAAGQTWDGYLANLTPSEFEQYCRPHLPDALVGADFLSRYGHTGDPVTTVNPQRRYAVRQPTAHPIYEHFRVRAFARLLAGSAPANAPLLGELMYQSHASYSACGLGSDGTDSLVALARQAGQQQGIYGAKITGGGSGGTVAVLARRNAEASIQRLAAQYAKQTGRRPHIFKGSSPGAANFGLITLTPRAT